MPLVFMQLFGLAFLVQNNVTKQNVLTSLVMKGGNSSQPSYHDSYNISHVTSIKVTKRFSGMTLISTFWNFQHFHRIRIEKISLKKIYQKPNDRAISTYIAILIFKNQNEQSGLSILVTIRNLSDLQSNSLCK